MLSTMLNAQQRRVKVSETYSSWQHVPLWRQSLRRGSRQATAANVSWSERGCELPFGHSHCTLFFACILGSRLDLLHLTFFSLLSAHALLFLQPFPSQQVEPCLIVSWSSCQRNS